MEPAQPLLYASFWKRFNAYGYDSLIVLALTFLLGLVIGDTAWAQTPQEVQSLIDAGLLPAGTTAQSLVQQALIGDPKEWFSFHDVLLPMFVSAIYNIAFVAGDWQATPGKRFCRIKVVMADGAKLTLLQSAIRHGVSGLSTLACGIGFLTVFFTAEKTALHDIICDTRVIHRVKTPANASPGIAL